MFKSALPFIVIGLLLIGCRKEKFSSDSRWTAPLLKTSLTLGDLIPDSLLSKNADNSVDVVFEQEYGISNLEDILVIPDRTETIEVTLSSLVLEDRSFTDTLTLLELYPASAFYHNQRTVLPAQDIQANQGTKIDVSEEFFSTATFVEGWIDITISNDLPVTAEIMEFELVNDDAGQEVIVAGTFTNLTPNTTQSKTYDLKGKTVKGKLELRVKRVKTAASAGEVLVDVYKGLRTTFVVRGLKPQVATAVFPAQNLVEKNDETKYTFGGAELTQVNVKTGSILMKVESSIEEAIILQYKIPQSSKSGQTGPIYKEWRIPPAPKGEKVFIEERFPIDGFVIHLYGKNNLVEPTFNHIYNELVAKIEYSGIERTLALSDKIKIEFGLVDVKPKLIIGNPGLHYFDVKDSIDIAAFRKLEGNLSLEDATLAMNFFNSFGIESSIETRQILGENNRSGKSVALQSSELENKLLLKRAVNKGTYVEADEQSIKLDKSNSNLKQFLENMPDRIRPDLKVIVRPNGTLYQSDFAFDYSELLVNFKLDVPLTIGTDSLVISTSQKSTIFKEENIDNIKEASLVVQIANSFPIQGKLEIDFLDANGVVVASVFKNKNNIMSAAELNSTTGKTTGSLESELTATFSRSELAAIKYADTIRVKSKLSTKDAKRYKMFTDYSIEVKIASEIVYENKL
jgi:hypothetical protein